MLFLNKTVGAKIFSLARPAFDPYDAQRSSQVLSQNKQRTPSCHARKFVVISTLCTGRRSFRASTPGIEQYVQSNSVERKEKDDLGTTGISNRGWTIMVNIGLGFKPSSDPPDRLCPSTSYGNLLRGGHSLTAGELTLSFTFTTGLSLHWFNLSQG